MLKKKNVAFVLLYTLFFFQSTFSQEYISNFKQLTINDGLTQNSINCIFQDKDGFMWFGTQDGLNRYDGYDFKQYRSERQNSNSLNNNYIWDIHEDENRIVWLATFGGGLNSINLITGKVNHYKPNSNNPNSFPSNRLFSIVEDSEGILWIGSNEGLIRFDKDTKNSEIFLSEKTADNTLKDNYIGVVAIDKSGFLWLRSDLGLTRFNPKTNDAKHFIKSPFSNSIELGNILDIKNVNGVLLVSCSAGLVEINPELKTDTLLISASEINIDQQTPQFKKILPLKNNRIAIATNRGLIIYNLSTRKNFIYNNDPSDDKSLSHNNVSSLFQSNDGIIWIGTRNGLNIIESENPDFIHLRKLNNNKGLSSKNVNSFIEENDSLLWIGTTNGLNLYNNNKNTFKIFRKENQNLHGLKSNYILCLFKDSKGNKWIGTRGNGFYKIENDVNTNIKFKHIQPVNENTSTTSIHYFEEDKKGNLWLGTGGSGLWKYNPNSNELKKYPTAKDGSGPNHPYIFAILEDSYDNLWLGTPTGGLNLFNPETEKFLYFQNNPENKNSLSNDIILSLHEDAQNILWIGTNGGLNKLIPKLKKNMFSELKSIINKQKDSLFNSFGQEKGFPNDVIYGMLEDKKQNLWISTNKGIVAFNTQKEQVVKTYDISHGLQSNEFNQNGYYNGKDGTFYFGGVNGLNIFHPDRLSGNKFIPPIVITNISILNEPVEISDTKSPEKFTISKALQHIDQLDLSWKHDVITLDFTALSFISPEKNMYSYKLEGFNENWIQSGTKRQATYTNLDPGTYEFRVKASNSSGIWNETETTLKINISSPPWLSWYAYFVYAFLIALILFLIIQYRINQATRKIKIKAQIEKARMEEREEFRKRSSQDFHDEAGNRITRISLITELAKRNSKGNETVISYLDKIEDNIQGLNSGMRDFIWALDPSNDNLYETLLRFSEFAGKFCEYGEIQFKMNTIPKKLKNANYNMSQRRHLLFILKEVLNNTLKYSKATLVELKVNSNSTTLLISLKDDGIGFDIDKIKKGNGLKNIIERAKTIGADIEIISEKNKGTKIELKLQT